MEGYESLVGAVKGLKSALLFECGIDGRRGRDKMRGIFFSYSFSEYPAYFVFNPLIDRQVD